MDKTIIACSFCGQRFDPNGQETCGACPLHAGCGLVRCPACGYETVDPRRSALARWANRWFSTRSSSGQAAVVDSGKRGAE